MERERLVALVERSQKGDNAALNELITACYEGFYYFALKTVKDENIASDITQESCIEIMTTIDKLHEPAAFIKWSRQIIYHQCTRHFRKTRRFYNRPAFADNPSVGYPYNTNSQPKTLLRTIRRPLKFF